MDVRKANLIDITWILTELQSFAKFYGNDKLVDFSNTEHNERVIADVINNHLFLIAEKNDVRCGFISGLIHPHMFNPNLKCMTELFWWISEDHRNSRAAAVLLSAYIDAGKDCDFVTMTVEDKSQLKPQSLIKRGFKLKEFNYILEK